MRGDDVKKTTTATLESRKAKLYDRLAKQLYDMHVCVHGLEPGGKLRLIAATYPLHYLLIAQFGCRSPYCRLADFARHLTHFPECRIFRKLRNWLREVFVQRIAPLLLNLSRLGRIFVAMPTV